VITVLVGALDDAKVPVDSVNATRVLLDAIDYMPELTAGDADRVARAVGHATGNGPLPDEFRHQAVQLAARCSPQDQRKLLERVAPGGKLTNAVRQSLLANAERLSRDDPLLVRAVDSSIDMGEGVEALSALPEELATALAKSGVESYVARKPTYDPPYSPRGRGAARARSRQRTGRASCEVPRRPGRLAARSCSRGRHLHARA
jgi:hypothetical protein